METAMEMVETVTVAMEMVEMVAVTVVEMVVETVAVEMVVDIYKSAYSDNNDYKIAC
jgi:hypothetical protein